MSHTPADDNATRRAAESAAAASPVAAEHRSAGPDEQEGAAASRSEADTAGRGSRRIPLRKIVTPVALFAAAAVFGIIALALYPSTAQLPTPPYASLGITSPIPEPVQLIKYLVSQISPARTEMLVTVEMPVGSEIPAPGAVDVLAAPPSGTRFTTCPAPNCKFAPSSDFMSWAKPLIFSMKPDGAGKLVPTAETGFLVAGRGFGVTYNSTTASAAIPEVLYRGGGTPTLLTQYNIPGASSYDWSSFPTKFANNSFATWSELVTSGDIGGRAAVGINHANQSSESNDTFIAGALIGLAGGALLSGFTEAMHARD